MEVNLLGNYSALAHRSSELYWQNRTQRGKKIVNYSGKFVTVNKGAEYFTQVRVGTIYKVISQIKKKTTVQEVLKVICCQNITLTV